MGIKPIFILRKVILLTTKNPLAGPFLRRHWLRDVIRTTTTLARDYTALARQYAMPETPANRAFCRPLSLTIGVGMTADRESSSESVASGGGRPANLRVLLALAALLLAGIGAIRHLQAPDAPLHRAEETRLPITYPVLESDRPDLLGAPHAADDEQLTDNTALPGTDALSNP